MLSLQKLFWYSIGSTVSPMLQERRVQNKEGVYYNNVHSALLWQTLYTQHHTCNKMCRYFYLQEMRVWRSLRPIDESFTNWFPTFWSRRRGSPETLGWSSWFSQWTFISGHPGCPFLYRQGELLVFFAFSFFTPKENIVKTNYLEFPSSKMKDIRRNWRILQNVLPQRKRWSWNDKELSPPLV